MGDIIKDLHIYNLQFTVEFRMQVYIMLLLLFRIFFPPTLEFHLTNFKKCPLKRKYNQVINFKIFLFTYLIFRNSRVIQNTIEISIKLTLCSSYSKYTVEGASAGWLQLSPVCLYNFDTFFCFTLPSHDSCLLSEGNFRIYH